MVDAYASPHEQEEGQDGSVGAREELHVSFCPVGESSGSSGSSRSSRLPQFLCNISSWYPRFSDCTFRTEIIPISADIADWLVQDGITLPDVDGAFPTRVRDAYDSSDEYSSEADSDRSSGSSDLDARELPNLSALFAAINTSIERLGGAVVPKMQWSCPKDACWMLPNNTIRCTDANDVCLLLKSSDRIAHDIETMRHLLASEFGGVHEALRHGNDDGIAGRATGEANSEYGNPGESPRSTVDALGGGDSHHDWAVGGKQHVIALRAYYDLKPGREFRCFVKNGRLCAISQRGQEYHRHLVEGRDAFRDKIVSFYETYIRPNLFLSDVVFDCYVPQGSSRVRLVDFNVFGADSCTHAHLFTWEEILDPELDGTSVSMRIVADAAASGVIRPSETSLYGVPYDFVHEGATEQLKEFLAKATL